MINATVKAGATCYNDSTGATFIPASNIRVHARIIRDDIEVTEFRYRGVWYTTYTYNVIFD